MNQKRTSYSIDSCNFKNLFIRAYNFSFRFRQVRLSQIKTKLNNFPSFTESSIIFQSIFLQQSSVVLPSLCRCPFSLLCSVSWPVAQANFEFKNLPGQIFFIFLGINSLACALKLALAIHVLADLIYIPTYHKLISVHRVDLLACLFPAV